MDPDQIKKYSFGCCFLMLALLGIIYSMPLWKNHNQEKYLQEKETSQQTPPPPAPVEQKKSPTAQIDSLSFKKQFREAYDLSRKFLASGTKEEKAAAEKAIPGLTAAVFEDAFRAGSFEAMNKIYTETRELAAASPGTNDPPDYQQRLKANITNMRDRLKKMRIDHFLEILKSGDQAVIDAEIEKAWKDPEYALPEKETAEYLVKSWVEAKVAGNEKTAEPALMRAAEFAVQDVHSIQYWQYRSGPLEDELAKSLEYDELLRRGKSFLDSGNPVLAVAYFSAAIKKTSAAESKIKITPEQWLERQRLFCQSLVALAQDAENGKLRWLPPDCNFENKVEIILQIAANYAREAEHRDKSSDPPGKKYAVSVKAWDTLLKLYRDKLARIVTEEEPHRVMSFCNQVMYQNINSYISFKATYFGADEILNGLPEQITTQLKENKADSRQQIFKLQEMIRLKQYCPEFVGKNEFVIAMRKAEYQIGSEHLKNGRWDQAFSYLRPLLREFPESEEALKIREKLISDIESAKKSQNFNLLYNLASFLIGELSGRTIPDDIKTKLVDCLDSAAAFYTAKSPMKKVFMLSLTADVLGDTPKGKAKYEEAMKLGFEAVQALPLKQPAPAELKLPSTVKGCSVEAIGNSTPYHLMAFYNGPEKFFVRLNPYRKGSLALLDGEYEIAVVVTSDNIIPYRAKHKYEKEFMLQKYYIEIPGQKNLDFPSSMLSGQFNLLRVPKGMASCKLEPYTGIIIGN